jgi:hypothetical protein
MTYGGNQNFMGGVYEQTHEKDVGNTIDEFKRAARLKYPNAVDHIYPNTKGALDKAELSFYTII